MGFYYISIFSLMLLGVIYGVLAVAFWGVARVTSGMRGRKVLLTVIGSMFLCLPVAEELWIAWNFGQVCREAGTFIYKKVEADGFYDSTMRSAYENTKSGRYRFVEQATEDRKGFERVERADEEAKSRALAWYANQNPGKELPKSQSIIYPVSDKERIVVFPNGIEAWRVTKLDKPTAKYHFKNTASHKPVSHQIKQFEDLVVDSKTGEVIAKRIDYARGANWFYIGLSRPTIFCGANKGKPLLIYQEALIPAGQ